MVDDFSNIQHKKVHSDYYNHFTDLDGCVTDETKKYSNILHEIVKQLDGLTCSQINMIINSINYMIKEKQESNIIKF